MFKSQYTKIEWTDRVFNPITGCLHNCWYCYAKRMFTRFHKSFEPTFYPERFYCGSKLKEGTKIFVCSIADLFAPWTPKEWREMVLYEIQKPEYNHLTFQLLTKNPENIRLRAKENIWVGATITRQSELSMVSNLIGNYQGIKFISFEPILERINLQSVYCISHINWIIVGKLTGSRKVKLDTDWINFLLYQSDKAGIPIFLKDNLKWHVKIQEFPNGY